MDIVQIYRAKWFSALSEGLQLRTSNTALRTSNIDSFYVLELKRDKKRLYIYGDYTKFSSGEEFVELSKKYISRLIHQYYG